MPHETFTLRPTEVVRARTLVRAMLSDVVDATHRQAVETVVAEVMGAAMDAGVRHPVHLTIEPFPLLTSVRLRCPREVELRDDPFRLRGCVLQKLSVAFGRRHNADGTADLWAEVPASGGLSHSGASLQ